MRSVITLVIFGFLLTACATTPYQDRVAACRALKNKMIFNGGTGNNQRSEIERSEQQLIQETWDANHCESLVQAKHKHNSLS